MGKTNVPHTHTQPRNNPMNTPINTHFNVSDQELATASGGIAHPPEEQKNWAPGRWLMYYLSGEYLTANAK